MAERCRICGADLTADESIARGYGARCAALRGLPYGSAPGARTTAQRGRVRSQARAILDARPPAGFDHRAALRRYLAG
jgi:hypothetical protein